MLQWLGMPRLSCDSPSSPWGLPSVPVVLPPVDVAVVLPELAPLPEVAVEAVPVVELADDVDVADVELVDVAVAVLPLSEPELLPVAVLPESEPLELPLALDDEPEPEPLDELELELPLEGLTASATRATSFAGRRAGAVWRRARGSQSMREL